MKNKKLITRDIIGENYRIISHLCNEVLQYLTNGHVVPRYPVAFFVSEKDNKAYLHVKIYDANISMHYFDLNFINEGLKKKIRLNV